MSHNLFARDGDCYVMDTNFFHNVQHYYPETFPSFWENIDEAILGEKISSVKEVRNELERYIKCPDLLEWINNNGHIFTIPSYEEIEIVRQILTVPGFRNLIHAKNLRNGWPAADPFVIAKAWETGAVVVTEEHRKKEGRIPDVCEYFKVKCMNAKGFMKNEGWMF